jgi:hypothetical protein
MMSNGNGGDGGAGGGSGKNAGTAGATFLSGLPRRSERSPNRISRDRHSSFTDLTQRSANEFKFGLLAGKRIVLILPDSISSRNDAQIFVSRSCNR